MAQPYVGQIIAVGFNFVPTGWLPCDGSLLQISQYDVLFNLIGTTYGGDGQTTFALPDLRGRSPLSAGTGQGLSPRVLGQIGGSESVTLTASQNGAHSHALLASEQTGSTATPASTVLLGQGGQADVFIYGPGPATTSLAPASVGPAGSSQPHENRQPFLAINYIIAAYGLYPSQN